jgi:hypothetical protein
LSDTYRRSVQPAASTVMVPTLAVFVQIRVILQHGRTYVRFQQHLTDLPWTRDHRTCGISHSTWPVKTLTVHCAGLLRSRQEDEDGYLQTHNLRETLLAICNLKAPFHLPHRPRAPAHPLTDHSELNKHIASTMRPSRQVLYVLFKRKPE